MQVEISPEQTKGRVAKVTVQRNVLVPVLQNFLVGIGIVIIGIGFTDIWKNNFQPDMYMFVKVAIIATGIFVSMRAAWDEFAGIVYYFGEGFGKFWIQLERELYQARIQKLQDEVSELRADNIVVRKQGIVSRDEDIKDSKTLLFLHSRNIPMTRQNAMSKGLTRKRWEYLMKQFQLADVPIKDGRLIRTSEQDAFNRVAEYLQKGPEYNGH